MFTSRIMLLALLSILLTSCIIDRDRERLMQEKYPSYPDHIKRAIDETYLVIGMDKDQVYLTLGPALCKRPVKYRGKEVEAWMYPPGGRDPCVNSQHRVYFEQERVLNWEKIQ